MTCTLDRYDGGWPNATGCALAALLAALRRLGVGLEVPAALTAIRRDRMPGVPGELEPGPNGSLRLAFGPLRLDAPPVGSVDDEAFFHAGVALGAGRAGHVCGWRWLRENRGD